MPLAVTLQRLLRHLLKGCDQPTHRTPSWRTSVMEARDAITDALEERPSLHDDPRQRRPTGSACVAQPAGAAPGGLPVAGGGPVG